MRPAPLDNRPGSDPTVGAGEANLLPVLLVSVLLHAAVLAGSLFVPGWLNLGAPRELPFEVMTVQLLGGLEPPAPAAPPAPVDPSYRGPDVVELPRTDPVVPQPTPLEQMVTPVIPPTEAIPIGERPPETVPEPVVRAAEPPPRVAPPPKPVEEPPKPKPRAQRPNPQASINRSIDEIRRRVEADNADEAINSAVGNIAQSRGLGNGTSSNQSGSNTGVLLDPERMAYYSRIREIVRANWVPPSLSMRPDLKVTVVIVIQPDGRITGKNVRRSSGDEVFDQSVQQAIDRSAFPPLPAIFQGASDNPAMEFRFDYLSASR
jgi:TonB family protein